MINGTAPTAEERCAANEQEIPRAGSWLPRILGCRDLITLTWQAAMGNSALENVAAHSAGEEKRSGLCSTWPVIPSRHWVRPSLQMTSSDLSHSASTESLGTDQHYELFVLETSGLLTSFGWNSPHQS